MHVLITGATGQLGWPLVEELSRLGVTPTLWSRRTRQRVAGLSPCCVDMTDSDAVAAAFAEASPDVVVHLAAMSSIAACCREPDIAEAVNIGATQQLASLCDDRPARLIYLSTDMVFDGNASSPYDEVALPNPTSVYGQTKWRGEAAVLHVGGVVLRIAMLLGRTRIGAPKFTDHMVRAVRGGESMTLFDDEWRTPLDQRTAAEAIAMLVGSELRGTFHLGGPTRLTRYELGERLAKTTGADGSCFQRASRLSIDSPQPRPRDLSLDAAKLLAALPDLHWPPLDETLRRLLDSPDHALPRAHQ